MLQSKLFTRTTKEKRTDTESISHDLLVRAGFIDQLMAGVYTFLPLGTKVLRKIENIVRKNMSESPVSSQEVLMPVLQPKENWQKTGRWNSLDILFKIKGSGDKEYALGPTHEEVAAPLVNKFLYSYKDLPISIFQIQTKFRDEPRAKSGILRTREFVMKDMYSFHETQEDLDKYYEKAIKAYLNIFKDCGVSKKTFLTLASGGTFSKYSHEFQMITDAGEDIIYICNKCKIAINKEIRHENPVCPKCSSDNFTEEKAVEVGNIFKLGTKFSLPFNVKFTDKYGVEKPAIMGCYGLGIARLMGAIVEANFDKKGIIWPKEVAPFAVHLIELTSGKRNVKSVAKKIYQDLQKENIEVLYDDRADKTAGAKFADSDLMGIPYRVVVSEKTLASAKGESASRGKKSVELKERGKSAVKLVTLEQLIKLLK